MDTRQLAILSLVIVVPIAWANPILQLDMWRIQDQCGTILVDTAGALVSEVCHLRNTGMSSKPSEILVFLYVPSETGHDIRRTADYTRFTATCEGLNTACDLVGSDRVERMPKYPGLLCVAYSIDIGRVIRQLAEPQAEANVTDFRLGISYRTAATRDSTHRLLYLPVMSWPIVDTVDGSHRQSYTFTSVDSATYRIEYQESTAGWQSGGSGFRWEPVGSKGIHLQLVATSSHLDP